MPRQGKKDEDKKSEQKNNQSSSQTTEPARAEVHTQLPEISTLDADITKTLSSLENDTSQLFPGSYECVGGDPLEVLRIKVASSILDDYRDIQLVESLISKQDKKEKLPAPGPVPVSTTHEDKISEEESSRLDRIISGFMGLTKPDQSMRNKVGLHSSMQNGGVLFGQNRGAGGDYDGQSMLTKRAESSALTVYNSQGNGNNALQLFNPTQQRRMGAILIDKIKKITKPTWHPPWKLKRVVAGHQGWVRCLDFDVTNEFFATGSTDRTIKYWDLASGKLKLSMTGHINTVRDVKISPTHTYLFSCSEDKTVRCWDLVQNKSIRSYHGHLSGVYSLAIHPTLNLLASGGRDATVRLWDMRTKFQVHCLEGHSDTVHSIAMQEFEPQCISGSSDSTIRVWDIGTGKRVNVLTNHKKAVRSLLFHHSEYTFCSAGGDNLKVIYSLQ